MSSHLGSILAYQIVEIQFTVYRFPSNVFIHLSSYKRPQQINNTVSQFNGDNFQNLNEENTKGQHPVQPNG